MNLRSRINIRFILFVVFMHGLLIALSLYVFWQNRLLFLAFELVILGSLVWSWSLYQELIRPLQLLMRGVDAIRDQDFNVKFVKTGRYETDRLIEVYNAMIDQLRQERTAQQEQHYFLEKLVQTAPAGIVLFDYDGLIADVNPKALEYTGGEFSARRLIGQAPGSIQHPLFTAMASLRNNESRTVVLPGPRTFRVQKGQFIDRGFPRSFVLIEELTAEILEAEKRSYGKVIRMMAHEVNNSIGAVNSILDTTLQLHSGPPEIREALVVAIERNDHLNRFMRNFADVIRLPEPRREYFDLHTLLKNVAQLMEFKARERGVQFAWQLAESPLQVSADPGQIEQVLINVVKNALEAIEGGGTITFQTSRRPAQLVIADTGKGIPAEVADKLFTPFFTDKAGGQGIGLTLTREILTAHGFPFSLKTGEDGVTRFRVEFGVG